MPNTETKSAIDELADVVEKLDTLAWGNWPSNEAQTLFQRLKDLTTELALIHQELEDSYILIDGQGDVPTVAQGLALARFLRPNFNSDISNQAAFISRNGHGLGGNYLHVRFNDGSEGGIDKEGRIST